MTVYPANEHHCKSSQSDYVAGTRVVLTVAVVIPLMLVFLRPMHLSAQQIQFEPSRGPYGGRISAMAVSPNGQSMYIASNNAGIFGSDDGGQHYSILSNSTQFQYPRMLVVDSLSNLFVLGNDRIIYLTMDRGLHWSVLSENLPKVNAIAFDDQHTVYAGTAAGLYHRNPSTNIWERLSDSTLSVTAIAFEPDGALLIATEQGLYHTVRSGGKWLFQCYSANVPSYLAVNSKGDLFMGGYGWKEIYRSTDHGKTWAALTFPLDIMYQSGLEIDRMDNSIYVSSTGAGVLRSVDNGDHWTIANNGLEYSFGIVYSLKLSIDAQGRLWAGTSGGGVYMSSDHASSWKRMPVCNTEISCFAMSSDMLFAGTETGGVFRSHDDGNTWEDASSGISGGIIRSVGISPEGTLLAGTNGWGLYQSVDTGRTWQAVVNVPESTSVTRDIRSIAFDSSGNYYVGGINGVCVSPDRGRTWQNRSSGLPEWEAVNSLAVCEDSIVIAGLWNGAMYRSSDKGVHWNQGSPPSLSSYVTDIDIDKEGTIFVGTGANGMYRSMDAGRSWENVNQGLGSLKITSVFAASDHTVFASTLDDGLYRSASKGETWNKITDTRLPLRLEAIAVTNTGRLLAGTFGQGVYHSTQHVLSTEKRRKAVPARFALDQNYPNPFNPSTMISFSLPSPLYASVKIFDVRGREVTSLVSDHLSAGLYQRQWNAAGMPSGVYFYRLQAGGYMETKRLILLR